MFTPAPVTAKPTYVPKFIGKGHLRTRTCAKAHCIRPMGHRGKCGQLTKSESVTYNR